jgi:hypothetical protein
MRNYLEERFNMPITKRTTQEFLADFGRGKILSDLGGESKVFIADLLNSADMIKFAKAVAAEEMLAEAISRAANFIAQTTPQIEEENTVKSNEERVK